MDASAIKAVSVLKLYRDSLRLAKHLGAKVRFGASFFVHKLSLGTT